MKRSPLQRKKGLASRAAVKQHKRQSRQQMIRDMRREWAIRAQRSVCVMCGNSGCTTGHHIVPMRILKSNNVAPVYWFDLRNFLPLCMDPSPGRCHERHELFVKRVPRGKLPMSVHEFAKELGLVWVLDREYE